MTGGFPTEFELLSLFPTEFELLSLFPTEFELLSLFPTELELLSVLLTDEADFFLSSESIDAYVLARAESFIHVLYWNNLEIPSRRQYGQNDIYIDASRVTSR